MSSTDWDVIKFETVDGDPTPLGRRMRVMRNGELVKGLTKLVLEIDVNGGNKVTMTQLVNIEGSATLEAATQALEEREDIWDRDVLAGSLHSVFVMNNLDTTRVLSWESLAQAVINSIREENRAQQQ